MKYYVQCPDCKSVKLIDVYDPLFCDHCKKWFSGDEYNTLPALSIRQPWAWLIANGYKTLENRSTLKNFRGDFLIHASKEYDNRIISSLFPSFSLWDSLPESAKYNICYRNFHYGGVVGCATIVDSITESDSPWFTGPNAFVIENAKPMPFTPCKGALGFFTPKID